MLLTAWTIQRFHPLRKTLLRSAVRRQKRPGFQSKTEGVADPMSSCSGGSTCVRPASFPRIRGFFIAVGGIAFTQQKNGKRSPVGLTIPALPELELCYRRIAMRRPHLPRNPVWQALYDERLWQLASADATWPACRTVAPTGSADRHDWSFPSSGLRWRAHP
jgi:hypothetical protein